MAGRNRSDHWAALNTSTGPVTAEADLETVGHGGIQLGHAESGQVLVDVGEGQDGSRIFHGALTDAGMELHCYPWSDRCLIGLSPDGRTFMTVDHGQSDVALHAYPDGEVTLRLAVEAFGHDPEEKYVEWSGGYLTAETVVVTVVGETEDEEEWFRHYRVDARTGDVQGELDAYGTDA